MPPPSERRPKPRKRMLLTAIITYDGGNYSFECAIRDLSETGAQVGVGKHTQFPNEFFIKNIRHRVAYDAKVIWNDTNNIGVTFQKTYPLSGVVDPSLSYLRKLWMAKATR